MTKEFHVFVEKQSSHEQSFVFEVDRDNNQQIRISELWVIMETEKGELRTRVHLEKMIESMIKNLGGDVPEEKMFNIVNIFKDVLPKEKQLELQIDIVSSQIEHSNMSDTEKLLLANELAQDVETTNISQMANNIINRRI
jgi:hypothetical protein